MYLCFYIFTPQKINHDELHVFDPSGSLVKFGQLTDRFIQADDVQEAPSE